MCLYFGFNEVKISTLLSLSLIYKKSIYKQYNKAIIGMFM